MEQLTQKAIFIFFSTAHVRRKHDPKTFRDRWTTCISMAIAKHGARVAIARAAAITYEVPAQHTRWQTGDEPLPPMHAAAIECAHEGDAMGGKRQRGPYC